MKKRIAMRLMLGVFALSCSSAKPTLADTSSALDMIASFSDRICGSLAASGQDSSTRYKGQVNAELQGLAKRLADAGVNGTAEITTNQYQGIIREALSSAAKDIIKCKFNLFEDLEKKLIPNQTSGMLDPDRVYNNAPFAERDKNKYENTELPHLTEEQNIDRDGSHYSYQRESTLAKCQVLCLQESACRSYTFVPGGYSRPGWSGPTNMCWLRDVVPAAIRRLGLTSGVKIN